MAAPATSPAARSAVFTPLNGGDRVGAVVDRLAGAMAIGLIADGEQLPGESELAASLGVATVTLREALARMRADGVIETRRGRGGGSFVNRPPSAGDARLKARLRSLGAHELRDLGDLQSAIGGMAARRAAQRADEDQIRHLGRLADELESARTAAARRRADGLFHVELAAAGQSVRLALLEMDLQSEHGDLLWIQGVGDAAEWDAFHAESVAAHRAIVAAVRKGRAPAARKAAEDHIERNVDRLLELHFGLTDA